MPQKRRVGLVGRACSLVILPMMVGTASRADALLVCVLVIEHLVGFVSL